VVVWWEGHLPVINLAVFIDRCVAASVGVSNTQFLV